MTQRDIYDSLSPLDYRYHDEDVARHLSENAFTRYKLMAELALVKTLARRGHCSDAVVAEVEFACQLVTTAEVYEEEGRIRHDIRALVNCIRAKVSDEAKPNVHKFATSYDIIDSANARRYRDVTDEVLVPALTALARTLCDIALRDADTVQVGRTHGQHAVPVTFGFVMAGYVSRLCGCIEQLRAASSRLVGKFSGPVGAYNALALFFDDPEGFESDFAEEMDIEPAEHSTQIVPPEAMTRLICEMAVTAGVLANLADDMRHLQRTEIGEVGEEFAAEQVGSSAMPQKRNPITFENAKSQWKVIAPRVLTVLMDQISEHQRDLTNSASARTNGEIVAYLVSTAKRLNKAMAKLVVDPVRLASNIELTHGLIAAEPLYIILASLGHPNAHEKVRQLTLKAQEECCMFYVTVEKDEELGPYLDRMTEAQRAVICNPKKYVGIAARRAREIASTWRKILGCVD